MPTFDVVSEVDLQEVRNAVDQTHREVANRFDFKGTGTETMRGETTQEVFGARDTYIGGAITAGYVY